jgi:hypothetical protein
MSILGTVLLTVGGAVLGFVIQLVYSILKRKSTIQRELKDNDSIDVTGEWYAVWQTTVNTKEVINSEATKMFQKGKTVKFYNTERAPENPKGGYLWEAEMHFYHGRTLMGWYFPKKEENNSSKGIMYFSYSSQRKIFLGKWIGTGYDGDLVSGLVVVAKNRDKAKRLLTNLSSHYPSYPADIVFNNLYEIDDDD